MALSEFFDSVIQPNIATVCCSTVPLYCCWRRMYCKTQHRGMTMPTPGGGGAPRVNLAVATTSVRGTHQRWPPKQKGLQPPSQREMRAARLPHSCLQHMVSGKEGDAAPSPLRRTLRAVGVAMLLQVGAGSLVRKRLCERARVSFGCLPKDVGAQTHTRLVRRGNELGEIAGCRRIRVLTDTAAVSGGGRRMAATQCAHLVRVEFEGQLTVRALDVLLRCARGDAKDLKWVERADLGVTQPNTASGTGTLASAVFKHGDAPPQPTSARGPPGAPRQSTRPEEARCLRVEAGASGTVSPRSGQPARRPGKRTAFEPALGGTRLELSTAGVRQGVTCVAGGTHHTRTFFAGPPVGRASDRLAGAAADCSPLEPKRMYLPGAGRAVRLDRQVVCCQPANTHKV